MAALRIGLGCAHFIDATLPELIEIAARAGFPSISVRPWTFAQALRDGHSETALRRQMKDAGVGGSIVDGYITVFPGAPEATPAERAVLPPDVVMPPDEDTCFRCAEVLEIPNVNITHYRGPEMPLAEMAERLSGPCRRARTRGLRIALEFIPGTGLRSLPFTAALIAAGGEGNCGITLDFFHLDRTGGSAADIAALPQGILANVQISDRMPTPPGAALDAPFTGRLLPGEGKLPLRELMRAALANTPDATWDMEVLNKTLRELPRDVAAARLAAAANAAAAMV